jgi:hypothetical protein
MMCQNGDAAFVSLVINRIKISAHKKRKRSVQIGQLYTYISRSIHQDDSEAIRDSFSSILYMLAKACEIFILKQVRPGLVFLRPVEE